MVALTFEEASTKAKEKLNSKLKSLETYEEFKVLLEEIDSNEHCFTLVGKRSGYSAFDFRHLYEYNGHFSNLRSLYTNNPKYLNRVKYLYSDGVSRGESHVKNLWRVLKVEG